MPFSIIRMGNLPSKTHDRRIVRVGTRRGRKHHARPANFCCLSRAAYLRLSAPTRLALRQNATRPSGSSRGPVAHAGPLFDRRPSFPLGKCLCGKIQLTWRAPKFICMRTRTDTVYSNSIAICAASVSLRFDPRVKGQTETYGMSRDASCDERVMAAVTRSIIDVAREREKLYVLAPLLTLYVKEPTFLYQLVLAFHPGQALISEKTHFCKA